jgi:hypothetical protein
MWHVWGRGEESVCGVLVGKHEELTRHWKMLLTLCHATFYNTWRTYKYQFLGELGGTNQFIT